MEWSRNNIYHPFNSYKALHHSERFKVIAEGGIPPPVVVNLDPTNRCTYDCVWCMAREHRQSNIADMTVEEMLWIPQALKDWKVKASCVAGGGDPTLNANAHILVRGLNDAGLDVGFVTNGANMPDRLVETLTDCRFVGFSMDAGYEWTYSKLKKVDVTTFNKVIDNIMKLSKLRNSSSRMRIGYKYLVHPENIHNNEIYIAIQLAKCIGVDDFQLRPLLTDRSFFDKEIVYAEDTKKVVDEQIDRARRDFEDESFKIYAVTHKFQANLKKKLNFDKCRATPLGSTWTAEGDVYLCVDRRGDPSLRLCSWRKGMDEVKAAWGSERHHELINNIDLHDCPRCTNAPYNEFLNMLYSPDDPMMRNLI